MTRFLKFPRWSALTSSSTVFYFSYKLIKISASLTALLACESAAHFTKGTLNHLKLPGTCQGGLDHIPLISFVTAGREYCSFARACDLVDIQRTHACSQHVEMHLKTIRSRHRWGEQDGAVTLYTWLGGFSINVPT